MYPYWPLYLQQLGYNQADIGLLLAIPMITKVLAPNLWSWLADASGKRLAILRLGSFLGFLCFAGILLDQSYAWLIAVIVAYSFFWNAVLPQHEVITLRFLGDHPEHYSRLRLWGSVGFILAVVGVGHLYEVSDIGWFPWVSLALLGFIFLSSLAIPSSLEETKRGPRGKLLATARQKPVVIFLAAGILLQIAHGAYYSFFSIYLEAMGYSHTVIGILWSIGVIAEIIVFIVMHNLLIGFGVRLILIASLALAALRWLLIGSVADILWLLVIAQILHAFSFGTYHAAAIETVRRLFAPGSQGGGQALYGAVSFGIGGALGSFLAGQYWSLGADLVFYGAGLACLIAAVLAWYGFRDPRLVDNR